jgi:hypothetical protein
VSMGQISSLYIGSLLCGDNVESRARTTEYRNICRNGTGTSVCLGGCVSETVISRLNESDDLTLSWRLM